MLKGFTKLFARLLLPTEDNGSNEAKLLAFEDKIEVMKEAHIQK